MFGDWVREFKYFWFRETTVDGHTAHGGTLGLVEAGWIRTVFDGRYTGHEALEHGRKPASRGTSAPATPDFCERVESGLFSYGGDTDDATNPFEVRLGKYIDLISRTR